MCISLYINYDNNYIIIVTMIIINCLVNVLLLNWLVYIETKQMKEKHVEELTKQKECKLM